MGGGIPKIGQIKSEIGQLEGQKAGVEAQRNSLRGALSELNGKKGQIDGAIAELHSKLSPDMPGEVKSQIVERISYLKNTRDKIKAQIASLREKLGTLSEALPNIGGAIRARRSLMQQIAGRMAAARSSMDSRKEMGRNKG